MFPVKFPEKGCQTRVTPEGRGQETHLQPIFRVPQGRQKLCEIPLGDSWRPKMRARTGAFPATSEINWFFRQTAHSGDTRRSIRVRILCRHFTFSALLYCLCACLSGCNPIQAGIASTVPHPRTHWQRGWRECVHYENYPKQEFLVNGHCSHK